MFSKSPFLALRVGKIICLPLSVATLAAKYSSGRKITDSVSSDSTTFTALPDVQA